MFYCFLLFELPIEKSDSCLFLITCMWLFLREIFLFIPGMKFQNSAWIRFLFLSYSGHSFPSAQRIFLCCFFDFLPHDFLIFTFFNSYSSILKFGWASFCYCFSYFILYFWFPTFYKIFSTLSSNSSDSFSVKIFLFASTLLCSWMSFVIAFSFSHHECKNLILSRWIL